jgi:hypothetical protein
VPRFRFGPNGVRVHERKNCPAARSLRDSRMAVAPPPPWMRADGDAGCSLERAVEWCDTLGQDRRRFVAAASLAAATARRVESLAYSSLSRRTFLNKIMVSGIKKLVCTTTCQFAFTALRCLTNVIARASLPALRLGPVAKPQQNHAPIST